MTNIRLQNPYMDETIKVKESCKHILNRIEELNFGHICCIQLHQIEPEERMITINPKHFAKVDFYEDEEGGVMSFYGGTYIDYCKYCDDRYSGIFKLKENENVFDGFDRWLKEHGREVIE